MKPHLVKWDEEYRKKGLVIVDIDNGAKDKKETLAKAMEKAGVKYATAWDKERKVCEKYGIKGYPAAFLMGTDGTVVWEGFPAPQVAKLEERIKKELEKVTKEELEKIEKEK